MKATLFFCKQVVKKQAKDTVECIHTAYGNKFTKILKLLNSLSPSVFQFNIDSQFLSLSHESDSLTYWYWRIWSKDLVYILCISLLNEGYPELLRLCASSINQFSINSGQAVIDVNIHPVTKSPKSKMYDPSVAGSTERLIWWYNLFEENNSGNLHA